MGVDDDVGVDVCPVGVPGLGADEAVGEGDWERLGLSADGFERGGVVLVEVGDGVLGLAEVVEGGQGFVDQGEGEAAGVGLFEDVGCGLLDHLDGEIEVGLVVPPGQLAGLALVIEAVLAAGEAVEVYYNVHVVLGDGVLGDALHGGELAAGVVVVSCHGRHVCPVSDWDAKSVDAVRGEQVNVLCGDVAVVSLL